MKIESTGEVTWRNIDRFKAWVGGALNEKVWWVFFPRGYSQKTSQGLSQWKWSDTYRRDLVC